MYKRFRTFDPQPEVNVSLAESVNLTDKAKLSLYKKSQSSGVSIDILEEVYRRGCDAWDESMHGTAEQFGFDRVNSFVSGGFAAELDEDLKPVPSIQKIADRFNKSTSDIRNAIKTGAKVEKEHTKDQKTAEKIATAHVNEKPNYYNKLTKAGLEEGLEKACWKGYEAVGMKKKNGKKVPNCVPVKEAAIDAAHGAAPQASGLKQTTRLGRNAPTEISTRGQSQGLNRAGNTFRSTSQVTPGPRTGMRSGTATPTSRLAPSSGPTLKPTSVSGPQASAPKPTSTTPRGSFGSGGGSMKPTSVGGSTSFSQGGSNVGTKMAASKQTSNIVKGMSSAGRAAVGGVEKAAASAIGRAAGAMSGPVGAAVGAAAPVLGAAMKKSHETGHASFTQHAGGGEKASSVFDRMRSGSSQGRSVSNYEKQAVTPKPSEAPKPKVDAPTPPSRPEYFSRGQAFQAARSEVGGSGGKFSYGGKEFQTNVAGEKYKPASQLKTTSVTDTESGKKKIKEDIFDEGRFKTNQTAEYQTTDTSDPHSRFDGTDTLVDTYRETTPGQKAALIKRVVKEAKSPAWQRKEGKRETGGLNKKGVESYRREHPGSKLKTAVTTEPSKLDPDSKAAKRRKSFCARMSGMKKRLTSAKTARDPDSRINKSLRAWNCEETEIQETARTARDIEKHHLKPEGWSKSRSSGEHDVWSHPEAKHKIAVPRHRGDLSPGTASQIIKKSKLREDNE